MDNNDVNNREGYLYLLGARGYSAYEVAVQNGFVGTEEEWLASLKGDKGDTGDTFDELTPEQKAEIKGDTGKSAYDIAVEHGFIGTEQDWVNAYLSPDGYVRNADVVDNLESTETDVPLSANQGRELKEDIDDIASEINQNDIVTQKLRDTISECDYYITTIPAIDNYGNTNIMRVGLANDDTTITTVETPTSFASRKNSPVVMNAGIFYSNAANPSAYGVVVKDGNILKEETLSLSSTYKHMLAIKEDGSMKEYVADGTVSAQDIINDGYVDCIVGYYLLIKNGVAVDYSLYEDAGVNPRNIICRKTDGSYLIFTCDGRTTENKGMDLDDVIRILSNYNIDYAFEFDGGGSTGTVVKGTKINNNIDSNGTKERKVATMLYLVKEENEIYNMIGEINNTNKIKNAEENIYKLQQPFPTDYFKGNLYNKADTNYTLNKYIDDNGELVEWTPSTYNIRLTDFIRVPANSNICISGFDTWNQVTFWDENKNFIIRRGAISVGNPIKTTEKTAYIRCIVAETNLDTYQLEVGNESTNYKSYKSNYDLLYDNSTGDTSVTIDANILKTYNMINVVVKVNNYTQQENKIIRLNKPNNSWATFTHISAYDTSGLFFQTARLTINMSTGVFSFDRMYGGSIGSSFSINSINDPFNIIRIEGYN